jgi:sugar phosphate isomerase/epimerase
VPLAQRLGLAYFRVNTGGHNPPAPGEVERAIRSFRELTDVAHDRGIRIAIENHGGISLDPSVVAQVIEAVGRDRMATLPDIGNFGGGEDAYEKIARMMPYAVAAHAKLRDFNESGEAGNIDLKRMVQIAQAAGFRGPWSIECSAPDAAHANEAVLKSKALLQKHLGIAQA